MGHGECRLVRQSQDGLHRGALEVDGQGRFPKPLLQQCRHRRGQVELIDGAVGIHVEAATGADGLLPGQRTHQPDDVKEVQQIVVAIQVAEMIARDERHVRDLRALRRCGQRVAVFGPGALKKIVNRGRIELAGEFERQSPVGGGPRTDANLPGVAIGPVEQRARRAAALTAPGAIGGDHDRLAGFAGVVERRGFKHLTRVVRPALNVRPHLQAAVPELLAAVGAGRHHVTGDAVVAHRPWRQHRNHHGGVDRQDLDGSPGSGELPEGPRDSHRRQQNQVRPELRRQPREQTRQGKVHCAAASTAAHEAGQSRHEQHGADGIGCFRRRVDRVE